MVTVEDLDVPDWPAGSLLSKYTMIMAKERSEVHETNDKDASAASFQLLRIFETSLSFPESTAEIGNCSFI